MTIEEDTILGPDQDGPSEYMADIGKGVLLANAKLKLLEAVCRKHLLRRSPGHNG